MLHRRRIIAGVLVAASLPIRARAQSDDMVTEVIPAGYRSAEELAAVLRPLVPAPGSVSGFQNQLVIRTTRTNLVELRRVLASLDKPPANLLITVKRTLDAEVRRDLAAASVRLRSGNVAIATGSRAAGRPRGSGANVRIERSTTTQRDGDVQTLRVLEGREAFIHSGESVPVGERSVVITGAGVAVAEGVRYEGFGTGFNVRPRLNGDRVTVDIVPVSRERRGDGSAAVQETATVVSGVLGRWMQIAGIDSGARRESSGVGSSRTISTLRRDAIYLKVERLN